MMKKTIPFIEAIGKVAVIPERQLIQLKGGSNIKTHRPKGD